MTEYGYIMSGDVAVARVDNGNVTPILENLMPIYLQRHNDFEGWLSERAIDKHRTNSRLLKKALRLTTATDPEIVLKVNAVTITDNYWFKKDGSSLCYDDVKFKHNMFDKLALYGNPDSFNLEPEKTPELTNIGSYEKCWRIIDGHWWLYKQGSDEEIFSELFISLLGKRLGFNMAHYEQDGKYIRSRDFTDSAQVNLEPMYGFVGEDEDYEKSFEILYDLSPKAAKDFVNMVYLDTICFNMDRHTRNYGVLKDIETGEVIGLAPNFDNNIALISRGYPQNKLRQNDKMIELFCDFIQGNEIARGYYNEIDKDTLSEETIRDIIQKTGFVVDEQAITAFIVSGKDHIADIISEQTQKEDIRL